MGSGLSTKASSFDLKLWLLLGVSVGGLIIIILIVFLVWIVFSSKPDNIFTKGSSKAILVSRKKTKDSTSSGQQVDGVLLTIRDKAAQANSEKLVVRIGFEKDSNLDQSSRSFVKSRAGPNEKIRKVPEIEELAEDGKPAMKHQPKSMASQNGKRDGISQLKPLKLCEIQSGEFSGSGYTGSVDTPTSSNPPTSDIGWGQWFTLEDLKAATSDFGRDNMVGEGGYGVVYRGQLPDGTLIAAKNLLNKRKQGRHEFRVEVETIGRVRHKNLVRLLGCCVEDNYRILVYEYVNNGNLEQWLHGEASQSNPLTWETRIKITLGVAKALAYLHEALDPKVVHRDIKSSNILLDANWNSKISDFGMAKLLGDGKSYITTRVMGTFGYVAPEYANTGILNEKSDVYSFGVLLLEIITGQNPVDYCRPVGQVNLVDWLKHMVARDHAVEVIDPQLVSTPSELELKRILLVALQCVDVNFWNRPTMGHVVHLLEFEASSFLKAGHAFGRSMKITSNTLNENLHQLLAKETFVIQRQDEPSDKVEGDKELDIHKTEN